MFMFSSTRKKNFLKFFINVEVKGKNIDKFYT